MSKLMPWDWRCTGCNLKFEEWAKPDVVEFDCPECGTRATRCVSAPTIDPRMGTDPEGFPTMGDKWARTREQQQRQIRKQRERNGEPIHQ